MSQQSPENDIDPQGFVGLPVEISSAQASNAEIFLSFNYPELKDLGKHFLTLSSATAVFVLTFIDKLLGTNTAFTVALKGCLISLLASVAAAGGGLFFNYVAGAGAAGAVVWGIGKDRFRGITMLTYCLYAIAGTALFTAYALLAYTTLSR